MDNLDYLNSLLRSTVHTPHLKAYDAERRAMIQRTRVQVFVELVAYIVGQLVQLGYAKEALLDGLQAYIDGQRK